MEWSEQDISLIESYLAEELSGKDLADFHVRMNADQEFSQEVELQRDVVAALKMRGRESQKERLAAMQAALIAGNEIKPYVPSLGQHGEEGGAAAGGSSWLGWMISALITIATAVGIYLIFFHRSSGEGPTFFERHQMHSPTDSVIRRDTMRIEHRGEEEVRGATLKDGDKSGQRVKPSAISKGEQGTTLPQTAAADSAAALPAAQQPQEPTQAPPATKPVKGPTGKLENRPDKP